MSGGRTLAHAGVLVERDLSIEPTCESWIITRLNLWRDRRTGVDARLYAIPDALIRSIPRSCMNNGNMTVRSRSTSTAGDDGGNGDIFLSMPVANQRLSVIQYI
jgi:hypothetical protein